MTCHNDKNFEEIIPDRVDFNMDKTIIDKMFAVDSNGQAYFNKDDNWTRLCIVASETGKLNYKLTHELGDFKIDFRTLEIYSKVLFLLFPNVNDSVFMGQLPNNLKSTIKGI